MCIVSAFGRGNWLASELNQMGLQVSLLDVSENLGRWAPEDQEGPFGFFESAELDESQISRVFEGEKLINCDNGFCLWLTEGPLELKGPLYKHKREQLKISPEAQRYLRDYHILNSEERSQLQKKLYEQEFDVAFLAYLAHQLASNRFENNDRAILHGRPLPLYSNYYLRRNSRPALQASLDRIESLGVEVFRDAKVLDLSFQNREFQGAEASVSGKSIFVKADHLLWQLTSAETEFVNLDLYPSLFSKPKVESRWSWLRYQFYIKNFSTRTALPNISVFIHEKQLPWTHENLIFMNRNVREDCFDVWLKLPSGKRFQQFYLEEVAQKLVRVLEQKLGVGFLEKIEYPQEYRYGFADLGPSRHPIYFNKDLQQLGHRSNRGIFWDGPELWLGLDWYNKFLYQAELKKNIYNSLIVQKKGQRDQEIQP